MTHFLPRPHRWTALSVLTLLLLPASAHAQSVGGQWETYLKFDGQAAGDELGWSVSGAGDVDGDGFDDLIVGAYRADPGGLSWRGSAYVYSGATGALIRQFDGLAADDKLGVSVSDVVLEIATLVGSSVSLIDST